MHLREDQTSKSIDTECTPTELNQCQPGGYLLVSRQIRLDASLNINKTENNCLFY